MDGFAALVDRHRDAYFAQPALASRQEFVKVGVDRGRGRLGWLVWKRGYG